MRKNIKRIRIKQNAKDIGVCFEPLEPRLLLSGSWGTAVDSPSPDSQPNSHDGFTQETVLLSENIGGSGTDALTQNQSVPVTGALVDVLAQAPPLNGFDAAGSVSEAPSTSDQTATGDTPSNGIEPIPELKSDRTDEAGVRELVFVSDNVADYEKLIADLQKGDDNRVIETVILDSDRDGIEQVSEILADRSGLSAIHFITHGSDGQINLGSTSLNSATLQQNTDSISAWGNALTESGDILFYGCDFASNTDGQRLVQTLANLTGADVAASNDDTGHAIFGADWDLEYTAGEIETPVAFSQDLQDDWGHLLNVTVDATSTGSTTGTSLNISHTTTSAANCLMLVGVSIRETGTESVSSVTYNGDALSLVGSRRTAGAHIEIWSMVAPDAGAHDVVVNLSGAGGGTNAGVMTFAGVDQTTPLGTFNSASGDATNGSATISSAVNEFVFGVVAVKDVDQNLIPGAGQTERWDLFTGSDANGGGSTETGAASVAMSWSWSASTDWAIGGVSIKPAAIGPTTFIVTNTNDSGDGSLRKAITDANTNAGADTISFSIPGTGTHTITPVSALPDITEAVFIDATTDDSFAANGNKPAIVLDGNNLSADGLVLSGTADGSTILGLVIRDFGGDGIEIQTGSENNTIAGNYIGRLTTTGADAGSSEANSGSGINLLGSNNTIGGMSAADRNVIAGNEDGLYLQGASGNTIIGNYIGTDATGMLDLGNNDRGIQIESGANSTLIGGTASGARNVVSGNDNDGIIISDGASPGTGTTGTVIQGNYIGVGADGVTALGNATDGIRITTESGHTIGGTAAGAGNVIAYNTRDGVQLQNSAALSNTILGNSIYSNGSDGIDLAGNGITVNDSGDGDTGANNLQNYPVITQADLIGSDLTLSGTLDTDGLNTQYRIEFFGNAAGTQDVTNGEGCFYLGSTTVATNGSGDASFSGIILTGVTLNVGDYVTATATIIDAPAQVGIDDQLAYGSTSEFAQNVSIVAANVAPVITSNGGGANASVSVAENTTAVTTVTAIDVDAGDTLTYSIDPASADAAKFNINSSTGEFSFIAAPDFETPTDADTDNVYEVTVQADDGKGGTDTQDISVTVTNADEPVTNNVPGAQATDEDLTFTFNSANGNLISISDDAGEILTVTLSVDNGILNISQTTGLTFTSGANGTTTMTVTGSVEDINAALDGLQYAPTADYAGTDTLTIVSTETEIYSLNIDADLVGFYEFANADPVNDSSPAGSNDGTLVGDATITNDPVRGDVLSLDGSGDAVQIAGLFGSPADVTLAAWVNLTVANTDGAEVISLGDNIVLRLDKVAGGKGIEAFFRDGTTWQGINSSQYIAGTGWHHVAYTFDDAANVQKLFIDGANVATTNFAQSIVYDQGSDTYIGANSGGNPDYDFNGLIDDARVYSRALTEAEVASLVNAPAQVSDTDTVSINVASVNDAPVLLSGSVNNLTVNEDSGLTSLGLGSVTYGPGGGSDESSQNLSYNVTVIPDSNFFGKIYLSDDTTQVTTGSYTLAEIQGMQFAPNLNETGVSFFSFNVQDDGGTANGGSDILGQSIQITVNPLNDTPTTTGIADVTVDEDAANTVIDLFAVFADVEDADAALTYTITGNTNPALFTATTIDAVAGTLTLDYAAAQSGIADITVRATDTGGLWVESTFKVTVNPLNDAPTPTDDSYMVNEDDTLTVDWWDTDWSARQKLTFQNIDQGMLNDFPVLVVLNTGNIDYAKTQSGGEDLRFLDADGAQLPYEIEEWNESGDSYVWVRIPQIDGASNSDYIWMYYGNAAISSQDNSIAVWDSNFVGVWHLSEEQGGAGNTGVYQDSTSNNNDGNDFVLATGQEGQVGSGQQFSGNGDWIEVPHDASLNLTGSMTISFWLKPTEDTSTFNRIVEKGMWGYQTAYYFGLGNGTNDLTFYLNDTEVHDTADGLLAVNTWQHAAVSYDRATGDATLFLNGNPIASGNYSGPIAGNTDSLLISHSDSTYDFAGYIDEIRISGSARSDDWIAAQYKAMNNDPGDAFVAFGGEELAPAIGGVLSNDTDLDGDPLTAMLVSGPTHAASFVLNKDGTFTYTPNANYHGSDAFTYEVNDGNGGTAQATVTITINPVNDAPTTVGIADFTVAEDAPDSVIDLFAAFADLEDADPALTYTITNNTNPALFTSTTIDGVAGTLTLDYAAAQSGTTDITVRATDTGGLFVETTFTVTVNAVNDTPTTVGIADVTVAEDAPDSVVDLFAAFADAEDADALLTYTVTINTNPTLFTSTAIDAVAGTLTLDYAPSANGTADITVRATDTGGLWVESTFTVTVNPVNDAPVAKPDGVHLSFGGDDFTQVADDPSLQMTDNVTMEAWINYSGSGTGTQIILNKEGEYELAITADTGEIKYAIAGTAPTWDWHNTGHFVTPGEWTHVAVTYDAVADEVQTYINGTLVDTFTQSDPVGDVYPGWNELQIGGRENATDQRFQGLIDEVRVWSTTRTQGEIQANMNGLLTGLEPGLAGNWRLDEGSGTIAFDHSTFGNNGILGGTEGLPATPSYQGYYTNEDTVLTVSAAAGVLANDVDEDGDPLTVTNLDDSGMLGILVLDPFDGSFTYDPRGVFDSLKAGEHAVETFTYTANDGSGDSNTVTVTITVIGVNDAPTATANTVSTTEDTVYSFCAADFTFTDPEGDGLISATITNQSLAGGSLTHSGGTAVTNGDTLTAAELNTLIYTPAGNATGSPLAVFDFTVNDAGAGVVAAQMGINVTAINDAPVATANTVVTTEDSAHAFSAADFTFTDIEGDGLVSATITNQSLAGGSLTHSGGTAVTSGDTLTAAQLNTLIYTPAANATGSPLATFDFTVNDAGAGVVAAQMGITVTAVNDVPVATANTVSTTEDTSYSFSAADFTFTDAEGDSLVLATITNLSLAGGTLTHSGGTAVNSGDTLTAAQLDTLIYTPAANATGSPLATFDFTVNDAGAGVVAAQMSINVTAINDVPTGSVSIDNTTPTEGDTLTASNSLADVDGLSGPISYQWYLDGIAIGGATGATYTAVPADVGGVITVVASYTDDQGTFESVSSGATAAVANVNYAPTGSVMISGTPTEDQTLTASNTLADADGMGPVSYRWQRDGVDIGGATDTTYILGDADVGTTITVVAGYTDGDGTNESVSSAGVGPIGNVNDAPITAQVTLVPIAEDSGPRLITQADLLANAADADGDGLTATGLAIAGGNGTLVDNADGTWTYTPAQNDNTAVSFSYTISDGTAGVAASATLDITPVNDAPVIGGGTGVVGEDVDPDADGLLEVGGVLTISDSDVGESSFQAGTIIGTYGSLTIDATGNWNYAADNTQTAIQQLDAGESLTDLLMVTTADGTVHTITITINGAADAPVIDESPGPVDEGGGDPDPDDEEDPVETEPDEELPIDESLPVREETGQQDFYPADGHGIVNSQPTLPRRLVAAISRMAPVMVFRNADASPSVNVGSLNFMTREPASSTEVHFTPAATVFFSPEVMAQALDHLQKQIDDTMEMDSNQGQLIIGAATGLGASVMVGYVVWAFRGASLLLGALSAMPMWRCFDPLPVLIGNDKKRDEDAEEKSGDHESEDDEKRVRDLLDSEQSVNAHQAHNGRRN